MLPFRQVIYTPATQAKDLILVGDIGGTNSNFGIIQVHDDIYTLLISIHYKSKEIVNFTGVVKELLDYSKAQFGYTFTKACFASAGVVSSERTFSKPTNLALTIDAREIITNTDLTCVYLANDFEVIGYGLNLIDQKQLIPVNKGKEMSTTNKAILGAGTGLGKCILFWDHYRKTYVPVASEGGHADFAAQTPLEYALIDHIKTVNAGCPVSWEDVLSGTGIQRIYAFFCTYNNLSKRNDDLARDGLKPDEIFASRFLDEHSWNTYKLYAQIYGRCAKNYALDALARGGVYIAGGIAAHNEDMFKQEYFLSEFFKCGKQQELLKAIPIYVITDYNISLYGAACYFKSEQQCQQV